MFKVVGCEKVFVDYVSGLVVVWFGLIKVKDFLWEGDIFVVWCLDWLGCLFKDLIVWVSWFDE